MVVAGQQTSIYKVVQAIMEDFRNTGYDKGHLNPNFYQCDDSRTATFTLTNAVPQDPCFNQQSWKKMEEASLDWSRIMSYQTTINPHKVNTETLIFQMAT